MGATITGFHFLAQNLPNWTDTTNSIRDEKSGCTSGNLQTKTSRVNDRMASADKIRARIRELASRPKNVTLNEIEWVMSQLDQFAEVTLLANVHAYMWAIDGESFSVCTHHKGSKQVKPIYVKS